MYITFSEYSELYDPIDGKLFNRLSYEAGRLMDNHTTGIDGVKKLKVAMPVDSDAMEAVKRCAAAVTNLLYRINEAESASGYELSDQGRRGKVITHVTAGNESISYSSGASTDVDKAVLDLPTRDSLIKATIREYLSGVTDANGVNLLFMGYYPRRCLC